MFVKRDEFIERKIKLLCEKCRKKTRIRLSALKHLPQEDSLDIMDKLWDEIVQYET